MNKRSYYLCENEDAPFEIFGDIDTVTKEDMRLEGKIQRPTVNYGLKPISSYKLKDLQDLHNLTGLTLKKTKKELYDEITEYMK
jgi:hypothetical protein